VSLTPDLFLHIEELKSFETTVKNFEPSNIIHIIPLSFAIGEKYFKGLLEVNQMESNTICSTLLIA
jgi:hypothetical protein